MSGKKQTSTSTIGYDPTALSTYQSNIGTAFPILSQFAQNPYGNPFFQMNMGMLNKQAAQAGQSGMQNIFNNSRQMQLPAGALSPFLQSQIARQARGTSAQMQSGRVAAMGQANQNQMFALNSMAAFQPLMTGQTTTEKQSGGTLSALLAAGLSTAPMLFGAPPVPSFGGANASGGGLNSVPQGTMPSNSGLNWGTPFSGGMGAYNGTSSFLPGESLGNPNGGPPSFNPYFFGPYTEVN